MENLTDIILEIASLIGAVGVILGLVFSIYKWYLKQNKQDAEIKAVKEEQCIMVYGLLACLKGLKELGCNGSVSEAETKLEKHINLKAHETNF